MTYRRHDTTQTQDHLDELEVPPVAPISLFYERCARASLILLALSCFFHPFLQLSTCPSSSSPSTPSLCALEAYDHLIVVRASCAPTHWHHRPFATISFEHIPTLPTTPIQSTGLFNSLDGPLPRHHCLFTAPYFMSHATTSPTTILCHEVSD